MGADGYLPEYPGGDGTETETDRVRQRRRETERDGGRRILAADSAAPALGTSSRTTRDMSGAASVFIIDVEQVSRFKSLEEILHH